MSVIDPYIVALLVYAPAFVANGAPVVAKNLPVLRSWKTPVWASVLGANKTWRGTIFGVAAAAATGALLYLAAEWEGPFAAFVE